MTDGRPKILLFLPSGSTKTAAEPQTVRCEEIYGVMYDFSVIISSGSRAYLKTIFVRTLGRHYVRVVRSH